MIQITYIEFDGTRHTVTASPGTSAMEAAVDNDVPGIVAECGGACNCATCHVYVAEGWEELLAEKVPMEEDLLLDREDIQPTSRLACQIALTERHDGLVLYLPEEQY